MVYLIIGVVLLLIIAPIIAVLPSPRQKEQMALRQLAMGLGMNVELTRITDPVPKQDKYISSLGKSLEPILKVIAYRKARKMPAEWRRAAIINWAIERRLASQDDDLLHLRCPVINLSQKTQVECFWSFEGLLMSR